MKIKVKIKTYHFRLLILALFFFFLGAGVNQRFAWPGRWWQRQAGVTPGAGADEAKVDMTLFWQVWDLLRKKYFNQQALNQEAMVYGAIKGMVASLGDPYTVFLPPTENKLTNEDLDGKFGGVGIQLGFRDHHLVVISPLKDTPAEKAGIQAGDIILKVIDTAKKVNESTLDMPLPTAVKIIRGPVGKPVTLVVRHPGQKKEVAVKIIRGEITVPTVVCHPLQLNGHHFAYLKIYSFSQALEPQWQRCFFQVKNEERKQPLDGLILDLRNNPGGYLNEAVFLASEFLKKGIVVEQENGQGKKIIYRVEHRGQLLKLPLAVLVNRGSASAAEILAGALAKHQRAILVGERTFGKGTVQQPEDLPHHAGLHITVARWLLPDGSSIDKKGIEPTIKVAQEASEAAEGTKNDPYIKVAVTALLKKQWGN